MIMLKSGNFKFRTPSSKQGGRFDLPEARERMKRKPKGTGHSYKSRFKRMREEETVPVYSALDKSEKVLDPGIEEPSFKKMRPLKKKDVQCSKEISNSDKDLVLGGKAIEASKVDERRNVKNTIQETYANEVHCEDQDRIPVKQKIKVEDQSAGLDTNISVDDIRKKCDKRMKKLVKKQKGEIEEFHRAWEDGFLKLEVGIKLEMAFLRSLYAKSSGTIEKLKILDSELAKKRAESNLQKAMKLKELEAEHLAARNEEKQKADKWLSKAPVSGRLNGCSKAQSSGSQNEEVSRVCKSRILIGGKDMMPLNQKHGENNDSGCGTAEDVALNGLNENPSIDLKVRLKNEGGICQITNKVGIISSDTQIPDIVEQIKHSGERVPCEMQSLQLHEDIPSELPQTVAEENVNDANLVNTSTNTPVEEMAEVDATDLSDVENSGGDERISPNLPASGESVVDEVQSIELHGDVPEELPQTVAEENVNDANLVNMSSTNTPVEEMAEVEATDLPDAENSGGDERISPDLPFSGESVLDKVQSVELHGDIPEELPETVGNENVDNVNMVDLSTSTPNEVFGEGDAIDFPDEKNFTQPKRFGIDEMLKGIPAELAKTVAHEIVDSVNPVESSAEGFGEVGAVHLHHAFLNQRNAADGTTIDDHLSDGQELKTSEQTEAFRHPCPLLPLQVQEDQDAVSVEVQVDDAGKINSSPSEVVTSELVDTAANSLSNIEPQACEEPVIEAQSSSTTEVSTLKIVDTVIIEQSSLKVHDHESSVLKDQVTLQIEVADMEIVDTPAPVSASEVVDTAETLQSTHEIQEQVEPAMVTRSTPSMEATVSQNLSSAEEQVEDALTVINDVSLDIDVSNAGIIGNSNPVQSHIDAPSIDSCSQLPSTDLECQNHNPERNSSGGVVTAALLDDSLSRLIEDLLQLSSSCDVRPENQSSSATRVQTYASFQNNAAADGASLLPSHQAAASNPLSLISDPLQNELERIYKETETLRKSHQEMMLGLKSECAKEIEELIAEVRRKYQLKTDDAITQFRLKNNELYESRKKIVMNKLLADACRTNCLNMRSAWPLVQQGPPSGSMQYHQQFVRPTSNPQISFVVGQPVHQTSVPEAVRFTHVTSRNGESTQQVPVLNSTRPGPNINQNSAAQSVPHTMRFTGHNGQATQQIPVSHATRIGPVTNQNSAAQSLQDAQLLAAAIYRLRGMNSNLSTSIPRFGENIQSSPNFQASTLASASSMTTFDILANFQNRQLQQQQQQQTLVASQWPSNSQNFQDLGYSPSLSHLNLHSLQVLAQNHQNLGDVQGNWNSCGGATTAIYLSDDD